jgi:hypothetical protein
MNKPHDDLSDLPAPESDSADVGADSRGGVLLAGVVLGAWLALAVLSLLALSLYRGCRQIVQTLSDGAY